MFHHSLKYERGTQQKTLHFEAIIESQNVNGYKIYQLKIIVSLRCSSKLFNVYNIRYSNTRDKESKLPQKTSRTTPHTNFSTSLRDDQTGSNLNRRAYHHQILALKQLSRNIHFELQTDSDFLYNNNYSGHDSTLLTTLITEARITCSFILMFSDSKNVIRNFKGFSFGFRCCIISFPYMTRGFGYGLILGLLHHNNTFKNKYIQFYKSTNHIQLGTSKAIIVS
ncbi:hypothetical protein AGLY_000681 [Aphis glycines]|uniref:Uncharacterized protein n=1 Tax=Aphis glycines TaxID=307491 RepID=A0A6G0U7P0_APHGL|nr:hypothetical protein AGLY_000681 [Aphis glycines]